MMKRSKLNVKERRSLNYQVYTGYLKSMILENTNNFKIFLLKTKRYSL